MIYGSRDPVPQNERLAEFVPNVVVVELDCGHWIADELPDETNEVILGWLATGSRSRPQGFVRR
jgi:pimeloyl-ACP methyl ester carboxylesterase